MKKAKIRILIIILIIITVIAGTFIIINSKNTNQAVKPVSETKEDPLITKLKNEKYYIAKNLDRYLAYKENNDYELSKIIADVNSNPGPGPGSGPGTCGILHRLRLRSWTASCRPPGGPVSIRILPQGGADCKIFG